MNRYSIWCDFIENSFLDNEFMQLLSSGKINGATSNPSIFNQAILGSNYYKEQIKKLNISDKQELFLALALADIKKAALKMQNLHSKNNNDGFISFEVNPFFANDAASTVSQGLKIANEISMPNLMIKVPATNAGYEAMYELASKGISVNATLIFSAEQAQKCDDALASGIKKYAAKFGKADNKAVVSIFVSRLDSMLNDRFSQKYKIGVENAIYAASKVKGEGVRALFASTGTKTPELAKDYYLKELEFAGTINTAPLVAINAYKGISNLQILSEERAQKASEFIYKTLSSEDYNQACKKLLDVGLKQFEDAFSEILSNL